MIILLQSDVTEEQIQHVIERVEGLGLKAHFSRGTYRTIIGVIGDETKLRSTPLAAIPGVAQVMEVLEPFKLASREAHPEPSVVNGRRRQDRRRQPGNDRRSVRRRKRRADGCDRRPRSRRPARTSSAAARTSRGPAPIRFRAWATKD